MINPSPLIEDTDIILYPFQVTHLTQKYIGWLNTPENVKYSELRHATHSYETCSEYLQSMIRCKHFFWAITHVATGHHMGNLTAYIDYRNRIADLAILIGEEQYKGKGYGKKAWQLASDYLLNIFGLRKISAGTMSVNIPMIKIFESCGMKIEAIREKHFIWNEQLVDILLAAKFHPDYV